MPRRITFAVLMLLTTLAPVAAAESTSHLVLRDGITVDIVERDFQPSGHKVVGCKSYDDHCRIDGRSPMGTIGVMPKTYVFRIAVNVKGHHYVLPSDGMYDAWGANRSENVQTKVRHFGGHCDTPTNCVFRGVFSDASETYVVEWKIADGIAERTVFTGDEEIVNLVMDHIDGPVTEYN
ncbi:hypothetical protein [Rhizomicrobium electricum]|uniref:Uncharacterized protein n=1 Tax=Rhizomicrobium electricum TaxID=480070 RepID=A0ABP3QGY1_9PROT|nr:hypothetical protein [Rhizomicrobium electricum]NIJ50836.1 hypothetical protein [Rhizomicrobium electricum]